MTEVWRGPDRRQRFCAALRRVADWIDECTSTRFRAADHQQLTTGYWCVGELEIDVDPAFDFGGDGRRDVVRVERFVEPIDDIGWQCSQPLFFQEERPFASPHHVAQLQCDVGIEVTDVDVLEDGNSIPASGQIDLDVGPQAGRVIAVAGPDGVHPFR